MVRLPKGKSGYIDLAIGLIIGYILNWMWETYKLFGFGKVLIPLVGTLGIGQDDAIQIAIGIAVYLKVNKNIGLGIIIANVAIKAKEVMDYPPVTATQSPASLGSIGI